MFEYNPLQIKWEYEKEEKRGHGPSQAERIGKNEAASYA